MVFLERAAQLAKLDGSVGFIIPNKFMVTKAGKGLRGLLRSKPLGEIVDFGDSRVFEGVTNYPCIVILRPEKTGNLLYRACTSKPDAEVRRVVVARSKLSDAPWNFPDTREATVLAKLEG